MSNISTFFLFNKFANITTILLIIGRVSATAIVPITAGPKISYLKMATIIRIQQTVTSTSHLHNMKYMHAATPRHSLII